MINSSVPSGGAYINVGHSNLSAALLTSISKSGLSRVVLLHDTIPLDFPQYARPGTPEVFRQKLDAAAAVELLIFNSDDTGRRVAHHIAQPLPRTCVAPLGIEVMPKVGKKTPSDYFICLGTIEPRKNHALLLDIWEGRFGPAPSLPLRIVGRRGWNNEGVFRRLDEGLLMGQTIFEAGTPNDRKLAKLIAGARALLLPSVAEGYGLPVAEALAAGVPVLASDLPALRAVGGSVPEWLPINAPDLWHAAISDYSDEGSARLAAQVNRMRTWEPPSWDNHFAIVENALETILVQARDDA